MMMRGPGIRVGNFTEIGSNVDVAPTLLTLAGLDLASLQGPSMDGKSLLPWLLTGAGTGTGSRGNRADARTSPTPHPLPSETRGQLVVERAQLGAPAALGEPWSLPPAWEAHWVDFYSLGNLQICGGGTCKGDRERPLRVLPHAMPQPHL